MRKSMLTFTVLIAAVLASAGCATTSKFNLTSDYDRTNDFSGYRTFAFMQPLGTDTTGYESLVTQTLKSATRREMEAIRNVEGHNNRRSGRARSEPFRTPGLTRLRRLPPGRRSQVCGPVRDTPRRPRSTSAPTAVSTGPPPARTHPATCTSTSGTSSGSRNTR